MKSLATTLLLVFVSLSSAKPWYADHQSSYHQEGHKDQVTFVDAQGRLHRPKPAFENKHHKEFQVAVSQEVKPGLAMCQSAAYTSKGLSTYVHVCDAGTDSTGAKQNCYVTNGLCCIVASNSEPVERFALQLDQSTFKVDFYTSGGSQGVCFNSETDLPTCAGCPPPGCTSTRCVDNVLDGDLDNCNDGGCSCNVGFAPPDCCSCDLTGQSGQPHYRFPNGTCAPLCRDFCATTPTIDGCSVCQDGYQTPDCCKCAPGYYMSIDGLCKLPCGIGTSSCSAGVCTCNAGYTGPDCCQCDPGYYRSADGTCKPPCDIGTSSCSAGVCTCNAAYTGPDCCQCAPGYYRSTDGTCKSPCDLGTGSCSAGVCTCNAGYTGPDCCQCAPGYYRSTDGTCKPPCDIGSSSCSAGVCTCNAGYTGPDCCQCAPNHYKSTDGTCKPPCDLGTSSCSAGVCTCNAGYTGPDCCQCAPGYYKSTDGTCKAPCDIGTSSCSAGVCTCNAGYTGPDCCQCAPGYYKSTDGTCKPPCDLGTSSCSAGVCTCNAGYTGPDCCQCAPNHYKSTDGTCKPPCSANIVSCTNGVCTCKFGFIGPDCCDENCVTEQDVYFLIDATLSNNRIPFCQTQYGIELMIAAMDAGSSLSGTRIGAIMYPKLLQGGTAVAKQLLAIGTSCSETIRSYNSMIDSFINVGETGLTVEYADLVRGSETRPTVAIKLLTQTIKTGIDNGESSSRRRIVVVVTDGNNDGVLSELEQAVLDLDTLATGITIIAAGNDVYYEFEPERAAEFRRELTVIANKVSNNVIIERNSITLATKLVRRMEAVGALCKEQADEIVSKLQVADNSLGHCHCINGRGPPTTSNSYAKSQCSKYCKTTPSTCRAPPPCPSSTLSNTQFEDYDKKHLEEEILASVEKVLRERLDG